MSRDLQHDVRYRIGPPPAEQPPARRPVPALSPPTFLAPAMPDGLQPPSWRQRLLAVTLMVAAWVVIAHFVVRMVVDQIRIEESPAGVADRDKLTLHLMKTQARSLLGFRDSGLAGGNAQIYAQARALNNGPVDQRLRYVALAGELGGPEEALKSLKDLDKLLAQKKVKLTPDQARARDILDRLYTDYHHLRYDAPSVSATDRQFLRDKLDWFGDLALAPAGQPGAEVVVQAFAGKRAAAELQTACPDPTSRARVLAPGDRMVSLIFLMYGAGGAAALLGFVALMVLLVLGLLGFLKRGVVCGRSPAGIYAETFAVWVLGFELMRVILVFLRVFLRDNLEDPKTADTIVTALAALAMPFSLVVLSWPVLRGIPWRQVREDIGWTFGRRPWAEPLLGPGGYVMCVPLLVMGLLIYLGLQFWLQQATPRPSDDLTNPNNPSHPVALQLAQGDWLVIVEVFILACLVAPIVEETLFRGVLYRHLRELTWRFRLFASVACSALVSSFIFAAIHPQGLMGIPILMSLACGLAILREWRGTLLPSMIAHGINNGLALAISIIMFAG
jgi:membrane protease YdiL (CAAX protease family)